MTCKERLEQYLHERGVPLMTQQHRRAFTANEIAASEHIPGNQLAKVVMLIAAGQPIMVVVPGSFHVDVAKVAPLVRAPEVRLAHEREFEDVFPDCEPGAMPPFGNLYNIPVYADRRLETNETIVCQAGTHVETISVRYADWKRLVQPTMGDFAVTPEDLDALRWHEPHWTL